MQYRLKIYDGLYEVLPKLSFFIELPDLVSPASELRLMQRLTSLTELAIAYNEPMAHPRLQVCDLATGKSLMELVA